MMIALIEFLKSRWGAYVVYSALLAGMFTIVVYYQQKYHIEKAKNAEYLVRLQEQNRAVIELQQKQLELTEKAAKIWKQAQLEKEKSYAVINKLMKKDYSDKCEEAVKQGIQDVNSNN